MTMAYNPYSAINAIYNYKSEWDSANKSGDTQKRDKAAENAKAFYKQLRDNDYGKVADELSSVDVSGAKYILDQYSAKNTGVDNQAYNKSMQNATNKNNTLAGYIASDRTDVQGKYNDIYNYANQDITKTDEYQSTFKNIMGKYDLSALQGRDNAVASGAASNGGNIDSYAAANAMRQQASLTAQGQQIAHQAGLEAANARVSNVSNILNNLGVYNSGTYDAMNQTVNNDLNIANSYFTNAETAKNNETARLAEQANVTGYTPTEWTIKNDAVYSDFLNADGTFKKEKENIDIQALINQAKASGDTETANKLAVVRYKKMMGNWQEYGKYANTGDISSFKNEKTEAADQFDKTMDYNYKAIDAEVGMNAANNQNTIDQLKLASEKGNVKIDKNGKVTVENSGDDTEWTQFQSYFTKDNIITFLNEQIKPYYDNGTPIDGDMLKELILKHTNDKRYAIKVEDAREIIEKVGLMTGEKYSTDWLNDYKNRVDVDNNEGMKLN